MVTLSKRHLLIESKQGLGWIAFHFNKYKLIVL
jgi:hypothetical protein